jgi:HK97 family phage prohead protease
MTEHIRRIHRVENVRMGKDGYPRVDACFVKYNVVDSYGTRFLPGVFKRNLEERSQNGNMPNVRWQHDDKEPIGLIERTEERPDGLYGTFRLDADPVVPRAMQAHFQLKSGTLKDVSVGFSGDFKRGSDGVPEFAENDLNELSIVSQGAVPGAKILALRSSPGMVVDEELAGQIVAKLASGEFTLKEALQALEDAAIERPVPVEAEPEPDAPDEAAEEQQAETPVEVPESADEEAQPAPSEAELDAVLADVDAMLAEVHQ